MAHRETAITLSDIQDVVDQIVDRFHPDKIWLFGSFAHGTPTSDSDVDLLVAMDTALRSLTDTPKIFARPAVLTATSSLNVDTMMAAGERPWLRAARCVGSISVPRSTPAPSETRGYRESSML